MIHLSLKLHFIFLFNLQQWRLILSLNPLSLLIFDPMMYIQGIIPFPGTINLLIIEQSMGAKLHFLKCLPHITGRSPEPIEIMFEAHCARFHREFGVCPLVLESLVKLYQVWVNRGDAAGLGETALATEEGGSVVLFGHHLFDDFAVIIVEIELLVRDVVVGGRALGFTRLAREFDTTGAFGSSGRLDSHGRRS